MLSCHRLTYVAVSCVPWTVVVFPHISIPDVVIGIGRAFCRARSGQTFDANQHRAGFRATGLTCDDMDGLDALAIGQP